MPSRPGILDPRYDKNRLREKKFALKMIIGRRYGEGARHHQVHLALLEDQSGRIADSQMTHDARIASRQSVDHGCDESGAPTDRRRDPDFPRRRVGEEFDVLHALLQFIEYRNAAPDERAAVRRRRDAARAAIKKTHA